MFEPWPGTFSDSRFSAACCIVASEAFVHKHKLENQAIEIVASTLVTDTSKTFESKSALEIVGYSMTKMAADRVFEAAGAHRSEVGVVELHDCFAANEVSGQSIIHGKQKSLSSNDLALDIRCSWPV